MRSDFCRLVLKGKAGHRHYTELAWHAGWNLVDVEHDTPSFIEKWHIPDKDVEAHFVRDAMVGLEYVNLHGDDRSTENTIRENCELWNPAEALASIESARDHNSKLRGIYAAALSSGPREEQALVDKYRSIATHEEDSGIRQAVIVSTGYLPWKSLINLVTEMRERDPAEHIRNNAQVMLDGLRKSRTI